MPRKVLECEKRYSIKEACELAGRVSRMTIYRAIEKGLQTRGREGISPTERAGSRVMIPASSLDRWLRATRA